MATASGVRSHHPQAFLSTYAPRIRNYGNALITPVIPQSTAPQSSRVTKRGTTAINYAEDGFDEEDFEDGEGPRRPTGLRSLRARDDTQQQPQAASHVGRELSRPIDMQGMWRDWMGKSRAKILLERQVQIQAALPLTLIPIRIDLEIQPFRPDPMLPTPPDARGFGIDENLPAYKHGDVTPGFRLRDTFLWNLHEALATPDQFASLIVDELDLPRDRRPRYITDISTQIRTQLEEYAGYAMHPLFQHNSHEAPQTNGFAANPSALPQEQPSTPLPGQITEEAAPTETATPAADIVASATMSNEDVHNPDDAYRCVINLNINLTNRLYTDKFEWSLLHPPGFAEIFSKQTCADLGLPPEWVAIMAHAIYEAVLKLKKEACENGGVLGVVDIDNDAAEGVEAGWRYEPERLAADWEPTLETLSREEIEKREGDRERQVRRQRRETARFSTTTSAPQNEFFVNPESQGEPMGRGERSKKKRRFRSLSPLGRDTPDVAAYGGTKLDESERAAWRCTNCYVWGSAVWGVRDGPQGPRSLCNNCGLLYERDKSLPTWNRGLFWNDKSKAMA